MEHRRPLLPHIEIPRNVGIPSQQTSTKTPSAEPGRVNQAPVMIELRQTLPILSRFIDRGIFFRSKVAHRPQRTDTVDYGTVERNQPAPELNNVPKFSFPTPTGGCKGSLEGVNRCRCLVTKNQVLPPTPCPPKWTSPGNVSVFRGN